MFEIEKILGGERHTWKNARVAVWSRAMRAAVTSVVNDDLNFPTSPRLQGKRMESRATLRKLLFDEWRQPTSAVHEVPIALMNSLVDKDGRPERSWQRYESGDATDISGARIDAINEFIPGARGLWDIGPGFPLWAILAWDASTENLWLPIVRAAVFDPFWTSVLQETVKQDTDPLNEDNMRMKRDDVVLLENVPRREKIPEGPVYGHLGRVSTAVSALSAKGWGQLMATTVAAEEQWIDAAFSTSIQSWVDVHGSNANSVDDLPTSVLDAIEAEALRSCAEYRNDHKQKIQKLYLDMGVRIDEPYHPSTQQVFTAAQLTILGAVVAIGSGAGRGELYRWNVSGADDALIPIFAEFVWPDLFSFCVSRQLAHVILKWRDELLLRYCRRNSYEALPKAVIQAFLETSESEKYPLPHEAIKADYERLAASYLTVRQVIYVAPKSAKADQSDSLTWKQTRTQVWSRAMRRAIECLVNGERYPLYIHDDWWSPGDDRYESLFKDIAPDRVPHSANGERKLVMAAAMDRLISGNAENRLWRKYEDGAVGQISDATIDTVGQLVPGARQLWAVGPDAFPLWSVLGFQVSHQELWRPIVETAVHDRQWVAFVALGPAAPLGIEVDVKLSSKDIAKFDGVYPMGSTDVPNIPYIDLDVLADALSNWGAESWYYLAATCESEHFGPAHQLRSALAAPVEEALRQREVAAGVSVDQRPTADGYRPPHHFPIRHGAFSASDLTVIAALTTISTDARGKAFEWDLKGAYTLLVHRFLDSTLQRFLKYGNDYEVSTHVVDWAQTVLKTYVRKTGNYDIVKKALADLRELKHPESA